MVLFFVQKDRIVPFFTLRTICLWYNKQNIYAKKLDNTFLVWFMKKILEILLILGLLVILVLVGKNQLAAFYSNQGYDYYENASYDMAIDCFNKSLMLNPSVSAVHYNLAKSYEGAQLTEQAISEYRKAIQLDNSFIWSYEALANIYFEQKAYKRAIVVLKEAEANASNKQEIADLINHVSSEYMAQLINIAMDEFANEDRAKAYKLLDKALQINPNFAFIHYTLGYFYYAENKHDKAVGKLNEAIRLDSMFFPAHKLLGDIYFEEKSFEEAVREYKTAISINSYDATLLNNLGLAFMNLENYQEAIKFLKEAVSLAPENINFRYSLASVYKDAGEFEKSIIEYNKVINEQPNYPNVYNDLANIYQQQGRKEKAIEEYKKELVLCRDRLLASPNDPLLLNGIACAYNGIGEYDKAKAFADKALRIDPDCREAYLTLATIQNNLCNFDDAMAALEQAKAVSTQKLYYIDKAIANVGELKFFPTDVIYMKNKRCFEGKIKRKTKDAIILEIDIGSTVGTVTLRKDNIERIVAKEDN